MANFAIILAGGSGTRFWPLSREKEPKQFLNVCSGKPMIEETIDRVSGLVKKENIFIAANRLHRKRIKACTRSFRIPDKNFLFEPKAKNTFAPILLLTRQIYLRDPGAIITVLPSDHIIRNPDEFTKSLSTAIKAANEGKIITFGVKPARPETGYGYIKVRSYVRRQTSHVYSVDKFIEKPPLNKARKFILNKNYYWNSGMFVFKAAVVLKEVKMINPHFYALLLKTKLHPGWERKWQNFPCVSFDFGLMEKTRQAGLLPAKFGWLDLGSWQAVEEAVKKDKNGNILKGNCVALNCENLLLWAGERLIAAVGLKDLVIVDTKDTTLICSKERAQDVKQLVGILRKRNLKGKL